MKTFFYGCPEFFAPYCTLQQLLFKFDFQWSHQQVYYGCQYSDGRKKELERFLYQYSHALKLENEGSHVIVYSDESWSNTGTSFDNAWIHKCDKSNPNQCYACSKFIEWSNGNDTKAKISKSNTGKRVVFLHAFSKDGLILNYPAIDHFYPTFDEIENFNINLKTAEYIFECKNDHKNDYHEQMDADKYVNWFKNRLIPTCKSIFNNKTVILFIDQAPFHVSSSEFPLTSDNKNEIIKYYDKYNIKQIQVIRNNFNANQILTFERISFNKNKNNIGSSKDELYNYLYLYLKKYNPTAIEPIISKIAREHGYLVLYSCPNNPEDQPAEFLNAHVKLMVKKRAKKNRTIMELKQDVREGFYGGKTIVGRDHQGINAKMIEGWRKKCHDHMNNEISSILGLNNTNIRNLWDNSSQYKINDPFLRISRTNKTLVEFSKQFKIIIDGQEQCFI